jgi:hypothetical protein
LYSAPIACAASNHRYPAGSRHLQDRLHLRAPAEQVYRHDGPYPWMPVQYAAHLLDSGNRSR